MTRNEIMRAADALRRIEGANLDLVVPRVVGAMATSGAAAMAIVHFCRWIAA